jgi:hypothetical protein
MDLFFSVQFIRKGAIVDFHSLTPDEQHLVFKSNTQHEIMLQELECSFHPDLSLSVYPEFLGTFKERYLLL